MLDALRRRLPRSWQRRDWLSLSLWPLATLFGMLLQMRRLTYRVGLLRRTRLPVPVVVVGNVVAGGSGKTPVVAEIARQMRNWGWRPGIVSRGYGRSTRDARLVAPSSRADDVGDEPLLLARLTGVPVAVARRRAEAGLLLLREHPEVDIVLADDGLQHLALARDIEICVFGSEGAGNGWLLPAGPLREPWPRAVDLLLRTESSAAMQGHRLDRRLAGEAIQADGTRQALDDLVRQARASGQAVRAVAGVAHPQAFFDMLRARGIALDEARALADHAPITASMLRPDDGTGVLLCTEKDATKLWPLLPTAWAVPLEITIEPAFWDRLRARLPARPATRGPARSL